MGRLLRGVARTAVVAGTATAVSGRVQRRQAENLSERDQEIAANRGQGYAEGAQAVQVAPTQYAPPPPVQKDPVEQIKQLAELKDQGILTEEEFTAKKAQILGI